MARCEETAIADFADIAAMLEPGLIRQALRFALKSRGDSIATRYMEILSSPSTQRNPNALGHAVNSVFENRLIAMLDAKAKAVGTGKRLVMSPALHGAFDRYDQHIDKTRSTPAPARPAADKPNLRQRAEDLFLAVRNRLPPYRGK